MNVWEHIQLAMKLFVSHDTFHLETFQRQVTSQQFPKIFEKAVLPSLFRHGLVGVYRKSLQAVDVENEALERSFEQQVFTQTQLVRLQEVVTRLLREKGIPCVVLKGIPLSERLYGDAFLRPSSDVDLLVDKTAFLAACECLRKNSFNESPQPPGHFHRAFMNKDLPAIVEIHENLGDRVFSFEPSAMMARGVTNAEGHNILSPTDDLLYLAYHAGRNYFVFRLILLLDIILVLKTSKEKIDWKNLLLRAEKAKVLGLVAGAFESVEIVFGHAGFSEKIEMGQKYRMKEKIRDWCFKPDPLSSRVQQDAWVRRAVFWSSLDSWEDQIRFFLFRSGG